MVKIIDIEQNSPEWLKMRQDKIGASDIPIIMKLSPYKTPYQLWEEKLGLRTNATTAAMQYGIENEEAARQNFCMIQAKDYQKAVGVHEKFDWLMASVDGATSDYSEIVEIKHASKEDHRFAQNGSIPTKYFPQVQAQMFVFDLKKAYYMSNHKDDIAISVIDRDDVFIEQMLVEAQAFYNNMINLEPPPLSDTDCVKNESQEWLNLINQLLEVQENIERFTKLEKSLKLELIRIADDKNTEGFGYRLTKVIRKGNIDYSAIQALKDIDLEKYRKSPSTFWTVKKVK